MRVGDILYPDTLTGVANAPGYRDVGILIRDQDGYDHEIRLNAKDATYLWESLTRIQKLAWEGKPLDLTEGETRPAIVGGVS